ncbi:MAG: acetyl-CoA carboxylase carboxyltransferase subunit alpha [Alphaproteobacteria bacterium]|nr:acetyl-CoA carboxylase carboxyltransferase subunit alpha [Alphaproteobacteria bacterium]MBQ9090448.1 acetyl-CoA carboxylase carboxyltransferase subunit alpha [Alphaproteobacteria bacterium]
MQYLDFEKNIADIEHRIDEIKYETTSQNVNVVAELERLKVKHEKALASAYKNLSAWQKSAVARHESRPHTSDYISHVFTHFCPLSGDRNFADDLAIIGGFAKLDGRTVMVIGHEKGHDTESRLTHNFGMAKPEGYRKAIRLMKLAEQFGVPVITLVDTAGAFPGMEGEERGQGQAIAACTEACLDLKVPLISCIIGEGGSGGAIALAAGNTVLMLEHSIYSVISPEGCASILWKDAKMAPKAAEVLHLTAQDLLKFGLIDSIIQEPLGGAHRFPQQTMDTFKTTVLHYLSQLDKLTPEALLLHRQEKFLTMTRLNEN